MTFDWRAHLKVHPAADLFPLLSGAELQELAADIKQNGLQQPIVIWRKQRDKSAAVGKIVYDDYLIDGRNRLDALALLGWLRPHPENNRYGPFTIRHKHNGLMVGLRVSFEIPGEHNLPDDDAVQRYVIAANIRRRHLTAEQKHDLIAKLIKANPEQSNRQIAKQVKADDKTVAKVRGEMERRSEIPNVETRTDTKGREQPAHKVKVRLAGGEPLKSLDGFGDAAKQQIAAAVAESNPAPEPPNDDWHAATQAALAPDPKREKVNALIRRTYTFVRSMDKDLKKLRMINDDAEASLTDALHKAANELTRMAQALGENNALWKAVINGTASPSAKH